MGRTTLECSFVLLGTLPFVRGAIFEYERSETEVDAARGSARRPFRKRNREYSVLSMRRALDISLIRVPCK